MIVIDASVWISFLVQQDVNHVVTHSWFTKTLLNGDPIAAPVLLLAEIGGAMARRLQQPEMGQKAIQHLSSIPTLRLISMDHELGIQAAHLAATYQLRGADAVYVAVAAQLDIPLVSWDKEQLTRANDIITAYPPTEA